MLTNLISLIAVVILVPIIIKLVAKSAPGKTGNKSTSNQYKKNVNLYLILFLALLFALTYLFSNLFLFVANTLSGTDESVLFFIRPIYEIWFFPALAISFPLAAHGANWITKLLLGTKAHSVLIKDSEKASGMASKKVGRIFTLTMIVLFIIIIVPLFDWSATIKKDGIEFDHLIGLQNATYSYTDITQIDKVTIQNKRQENIDNYYVVHFSDSTEWNTLYGLNDVAHQEDIFVFLAKEANLEISDQVVTRGGGNDG